MTTSALMFMEQRDHFVHGSLTNTVLMGGLGAIPAGKRRDTVDHGSPSTQAWWEGPAENSKHGDLSRDLGISA